MRKLSAISAVIVMSLLLFACDNEKKQELLSELAATNGNIVAMDNAHNAENSLDVNGTYYRFIPTEGDKGMGYEVILTNNSYMLSTFYLNEDNNTRAALFEDSGDISWDETGSIITLNGAQTGANRYLVGENSLIPVGEDINEEDVAKYTLIKQ